VNLIKILAQFQNKKVTIIGDIILDEYVWGDVNRISPEAPVPVFESVGEHIGCGGAANVAQNVVSLGGQVELIGVIGKDRDGEKLIRMLNTLGIGSTDICLDIQRPTSKKSRVIVRPKIHNSTTQNQENSENLILEQGYHLLRIDNESKQEIGGFIRERLLRGTLSHIADSDAVIFADYDKGAINSELIKAVVWQAKHQDIPIIVDPKINNFWDYEGVTALTPNHKEAGAAVLEEITDISHLISVGERILDRLSLHSLLITREEEGMSLFQRDSAGILKVKHFLPHTHKVIDVTGAGDTVCAVYALALASNADNYSAVQLSNIAGGIVVRKMGCAVVTPDELHKEIHTMQ